MKLPCYVHRFWFNLILGRIFSSPYYWISCYHVKYKDFSSISYLDTFSVHLSVKSHVTIVKNTDFSSILYLDTFSVHLTIESHVTMLSTKILVQSHTWIHFQFTFLLNLMLLLLSTQVQFNLTLGTIFIPYFCEISCYHVKYKDFSSISYLDTFSVHLSVKSHVTIVKNTDFSSILYLTHFQFTFLLNLMFTMLSTQIFLQSYTWIHFHSFFLLNLMFSMLSTQISYKYHIYSQCSL